MMKLSCSEEKMTGPSMEANMVQTATLNDMIVSPELSVHLFDKSIGIYSNRLEAGRGFSEMLIQDFIALLDHFTSEPSRTLLDSDRARKGRLQIWPSVYS